MNKRDHPLEIQPLETSSRVLLGEELSDPQGTTTSLLSTV